MAEAEKAHSIRLLTILRKLMLAIIGLLIFILALSLLKDGARSYGQSLITMLHISNPVNTLGFGWLLAYIFLSGSPVAAVAVSFFASGTINAVQTLTMITGSRLGASFIVLFVGFLYYLRGHHRSASIAIGVLALLTTAATYLPALAIGYWMLTSGVLQRISPAADAPLDSIFEVILNPILDRINALHLPGWALMLLGVAILLTAFRLLDMALPEIGPGSSSFQRIGQLIYRPWAMFLLGCAITSVTLSVSVSISILVPLSARGLVRRENTLPYIMGANITTFIDTLVAALITGGQGAFTIVLAEMLSVMVISLLILLTCYRPFARLILQIQDRVLQSTRSLAVFLGIMLLVPVLLLLIQ